MSKGSAKTTEDIFQTFRYDLAKYKIRYVYILLSYLVITKYKISYEMFKEIKFGNTK